MTAAGTIARGGCNLTELLYCFDARLSRTDNWFWNKDIRFEVETVSAKTADPINPHVIASPRPIIRITAPRPVLLGGILTEFAIRATLDRFTSGAQSATHTRT